MECRCLSGKENSSTGEPALPCFPHGDELHLGALRVPQKLFLNDVKKHQCYGMRMELLSPCPKSLWKVMC